MESLRDRVAELAPLLRGRADASEDARRISVETMGNLRDVGFFRSLVPRRFGGDQRNLSEVHEATIELARACSSTAWVGSLLAIHALGIAWFDERAQKEIWEAGPDAFVVSSFAPTGTLTRDGDNFRLSGRWSFVSGADHGTWVLFGGMLREAKEPEYFLLSVPASDISIVDDWHVAGLKATGSKSIVLDNVLVPAHRALSKNLLVARTAPGTLVHDAPLYRMSWKAVFDSAFPPVALGTALANLDAFREYVGTRTHAINGAGFRGSAGHLMRLAEASAVVESARLLFKHDVAELEATGASLPTLEAQARLEQRLGYDFAFTTDRCSYAVAKLFRGSGGRALYTKSTLQRYFRDINAMTQHVVSDLDLLGPAYGATLVGPQ